tara:strand:+ start:3464 stop:3787 length:324 start_codon:yes stop_codon:yes gene_type:complete
MSHLFITNCENNKAYPIAIAAEDGWAISPFFEQEEFTEWLHDQGTSDLEMVQADKAIRQYTSSCPGCGSPIVLLPDEEQVDHDIMNYECTNCGDSSSIEFTETEDDE